MTYLPIMPIIETACFPDAGLHAYARSCSSPRCPLPVVIALEQFGIAKGLLERIAEASLRLNLKIRPSEFGPFSGRLVNFLGEPRLPSYYLLLLLEVVPAA